MQTTLCGMDNATPPPCEMDNATRSSSGKWTMSFSLHLEWIMFPVEWIMFPVEWTMPLPLHVEWLIVTCLESITPCWYIIASGFCTLLPQVFVHYCLRFLYIIASGFCTLLPQVFVHYCLRFLYIIASGFCTLLPQVFVHYCLRFLYIIASGFCTLLPQVFVHYCLRFLCPHLNRTTDLKTIVTAQACPHML